MSVSSTTYENFQTSSQVWAADGGPWQGSFQPPNSRIYPFTTLNQDYCDGVCLTVAIASRPDGAIGQPAVSSYTIVARANISVDTAQYGNPTSLDFTWTIWPTYILSANKPAEASSLPLHVQINDVGFDDTFPAKSFIGTYDRTLWSGSPISHSGTASLNPGSSNGRSFISIVLNTTTFATDVATGLSLLMKGVTFKITTPTALAPSSSLSTPSLSSLSSTSLTSSSSGTSSGPQSTSSPVTLGDPSTPPSSSPTSQQSSSTALAPSVETAKISTAAIGGLAVGIVALVTLLVIGFLFYRKRKNKDASSDSLAHEPIMYEFNTYPMEKYPRSGSNGITPSSSEIYQIPIIASQITSIPATTPANPIAPLDRSGYSAYGGGTSTMGREPPPMYGTVDGYVSDVSDEIDPSPLAIFASSHRELISEDLEARLEAAGYLPTVDPDSFTEAEWLSRHNLTKLEVMRLRRLYQMGRQRANWQQPKSPSGGMR